MNQQDIAELKRDVENLNMRLTNLERSVTLIESNHGDRISALFDYIEVNKDEHKRLENLILDIKSQFQVTLFNHEKRITKLEGNLVPSF